MIKAGKQVFKNALIYRKANRMGQNLLYCGLRNQMKRDSYKKRFEVLKNFPYKFENNRTIIKEINTFRSDEESILQQLKDAMHDPEINLHDGFSFAYQALLGMICDQDHRGLTGIVEPTLRKDITEELSDIVYENIDLNIENEEDHSMKIDIIDFAYHLGADINRQHNANLRLKKYNFNRFWSGDQNVRTNLYVNEQFEFGKDLIFNLEVLVRFITNFKLNAT